MTQRPEPLIFKASLGRRAWQSLLGAGSLLVCLGAPSSAAAQADVSPPPPNVLLLVDTSGSMDYKTNSNSFPECRYVGEVLGTVASERSRWIELVEVLTGSINDYECQRLDRNSTNFKLEYKGGSANPYDFLYPNPYHRPVSNGCVPGPGAVDAGNAALFLPNAINYHDFDNISSTCTTFDQASDGVLDAFLNEVRFGLMTFDTDPAPAKDVSGLWSYYGGSPMVGRPAGCLIDQAQEVGIRNPEAPPWEGRAVGFGNPALGSVDYKSRNAMIQQVLLATRPYGATPIAGMLDDARDYLLNDTDPDPIDASFNFGPGVAGSDPAEDCRPKSIVLLSDGQPNMDLRPFCEPGGCPYDKAEDIAEDLKSKGIYTYVIGFALASLTVDGNPLKCSDFLEADFDESNASGICAAHPDDSGIQACCSLNRIAAAGGPTPAGPKSANWLRAHFADNRDELRAALSNAIGGNLKSTSRTPITNASGAGFVGAGANLDFARSFRFAAGFDPKSLDEPWLGKLNRLRWVCESDPLTSKSTPKLLEADLDKGDFFVENVNASGPGARTFFSVVGAAPVESDASIRPNLPVGADDGVGTYTGTMDPLGLSATTFVSSTTPAAIGVDNSTCDTSSSDKTDVECRDHYLKWLVGLDNGTSAQRCPSVAGGDCSLVGDIYHSSPRAVAGLPSEFLNDESYLAFADQMATAKRPSVLYVSTNDGFLHAFKIGPVSSDVAEVKSVDTKENNELWALVPPGTLRGLPSQYPGSHQLLLDGSPVVKDVTATKDLALPGYKYRLERTQADAQAGAGSWRTILVQSFGAGRPGYFALDVTEPVPSSDGLQGPKFLWQLTEAEDGSALFGSGGATPLITTVFIDEKEVAVAVLPGGFGSAGTDAPGSPGTGCARKTTDFTDFGMTYPPRGFVPCYSGSAVKARSLTVVRLDSGEILRTFRQDDDEVPTLKAQDVVTEAPIDSPLTGQPVAFPSDVGAVADRVFIGDQDGGIWRLNFASDDGSPDDWKMELFFDGFPGGTLGHDWNDGQPVATPPIISVDPVGNLTVAFSTGEQEAIGMAPGLTNYVWSLIEKPNADRTKLLAVAQWYLDFKDAPLEGDRVIGPMALFSGELYFSTVGPVTNGDACSSGSGKTFGMHYLKPAAVVGAGGVLAESLKDLLGSDGFVEASTLLGSDPQAFLSGASIAQQPTCDDPGSSADNQFFSNGTHRSFGALTPGKFQLIIPTGSQRSTATGSNISSESYGGVNAVVVDLKAPAVTNRVDSWAAIIE